MPRSVTTSGEVDTSVRRGEAIAPGTSLDTLLVATFLGMVFHTTFHFARDTRGRHATPRDTLWLMLLNFPNGVGG
jgi:hypothetical protein